MAYGLHWEWRAFGSLTPRFSQTYFELPVHYQPHQVTDDYLWIPGLEVNAKFRTGVEDGLKFKRIQKKEGNFEVWLEDEDELFEFPLHRDAWQAIATMLGQVNIQLPTYPASAPGREQTSKILENAGCKIITVSKKRETRKLTIDNGCVLVEWAVVTEPQHCTTVGLETWSANSEADMAGASALHTLKQAVAELGISQEPVQPGNYLDAIKLWGKGSKI